VHRPIDSKKRDAGVKKRDAAKCRIALAELD
jgi:hypothetical protein